MIEVTQELEARHKLFFGQKWKLDNRPLLPDTPDYFGVKSFNLWVIQYPYGWKRSGDSSNYVYSWPPDTWFDPLFMDSMCSYKTLVWVDMSTAKRVKQRFPQSDMVYMMRRTATGIQEYCSQNAAYFEYKGILETQVAANFFDPYLEEFIGHPAYSRA